MERRTLIAALLVSLSLILAFASLYTQWLGQETGHRLRVAIYVGPRTWRDGLQAIELYLQSRNISYREINSRAIRSGNLEDYDLLIVPGGWAYSYSLDLGRDGGEIIKKYVERGGVYLGICAGGYYAAKLIVWESENYSYSLGILDSIAEGPKKGYPWPTYAYVKINIAGIGVSRGLNKTYIAVYYGGPEFRGLGRNAYVLAFYHDDGRPAIVIGPYGRGRVAATGVHLEVRKDTWPVLDVLLQILFEGR